MDLLTKIDTIKSSSTLKPLMTDNAKDYDELWEKVIKPNLPKKEAVEGWHKILMNYIKRDNAVFFMRAFGQYISKAKDETVLRRGFYNITNHNFSAFYGDNFFTSYFYSMALDGFVPNQDEFYDAMINRRFPCGFMQTNIEKEYAAFVNGRNPEITKKGYKIAHIFSAGKDFNEKCPYKSISDFCNSNFPRGNRIDWVNTKTDSLGSFHYRLINYNSNEEANRAKKFLIAHFLRTVHPINYFLVPNKSNTRDKATGIIKTNIYWHDGIIEKDEIGENPGLIKYVSAKIRAEYGKIYDEYLQLIYPIIDDTPVENIIINAKYGIDIWKDRIALSDTTLTHKKASKVTKNIGNLKTDHLILAYYYLCNYTTFEKIDKEMLKCKYDSHGGKSCAILKKLGITKKNNNIISTTNTLNFEIEKATGIYKDTLIKIKELINKGEIKQI